MKLVNCIDDNSIVMPSLFEKISALAILLNLISIAMYYLCLLTDRSMGEVKLLLKCESNLELRSEV